MTDVYEATVVNLDTQELIGVGCAPVPADAVRNAFRSRRASERHPAGEFHVELCLGDGSSWLSSLRAAGSLTSDVFGVVEGLI